MAAKIVHPLFDGGHFRLVAETDPKRNVTQFYIESDVQVGLDNERVMLRLRVDITADQLQIMDYYAAQYLQQFDDPS